MLPMRLALLSILLVLPVAAQETSLTPYVANDGRIVLSFHHGALADRGLELLELVTTDDLAGPAGLETTDGVEMGFRIREGADLKALRNSEGQFQAYGILGGSLVADGGFILHSPSTNKSVDFHGFEIVAKDVASDGPGGGPDPDYFYLNAAGTSGEGLENDFLVSSVKIYFTNEVVYDSGQDHPFGPLTLRVKAWALTVEPWLAKRLGRADLEGVNLGSGRIEALVEPFAGAWEHPKGQNVFTPLGGAAPPPAGGAEGSFLDVSLGILSSITQLGRTGSFPNGRVGMSMSTTSCNLGDVNVPWLKAESVLQENHPGIAMQLYREMNGRFEQVGVSWIKHGFFALSNSQCIPCQNPSNGTFLGVGCSDTYGTSNNGNRFWLGPRDEWNAHDKTWEADGSFFDGIPAGDNQRDETGSGNGNVNHRLEAFESDLDLNGATYWYEAYYLVQGDQDNHNNIGSRECDMFWNGFSWQFSTPPSSINPLVEGPAIQRWGEMHTQAGLEPADGEVILAVDCTDLGGGQYRYEYALFNWTLDRRIRQFSVPNRGPVADVYFHDTDGEASNNWVVSTVGKNITWTFPDVFPAGHKVAGPLGFGTLYNFGFTSAFPPATQDAALVVHDAGPGGDLFAVETLAPGIVSVSARPLAPVVGGGLDIVARNGEFGALFAILGVNGSPLGKPIILNNNAVAFVGGEAVLSVVVPNGLEGVSLDLIAANFDTSVVNLSNVSTIKIQN